MYLYFNKWIVLHLPILSDFNNNKIRFNNKDFQLICSYFSSNHQCLIFNSGNSISIPMFIYSLHQYIYKTDNYDREIQTPNYLAYYTFVCQLSWVCFGNQISLFNISKMENLNSNPTRVLQVQKNIVLIPTSFVLIPLQT